jgi:prepilin-type N-terminal cleavage/methylation domain-containing protein
MTAPYRPQRRAFSLIEMIVVVSLLAVFMLVATRLFNMCWKTINVAATGQNEANQNLAMLNLLRNDVWSAGQVRIVDAATLELATETGEPLKWTFGPEAAALRAADNLAAFATPGTILSVAPHETGAILKVTARDQQESIMLFNRRMASAGRAP